MTFPDIVKEIHNSHCEYDMLVYLARWVGQENNRIIMENCELHSSVDLIKKFNDAKWHEEIIDALTERRSVKHIVVGDLA